LLFLGAEPERKKLYAKTKSCGSEEAKVMRCWGDFLPCLWRNVQWSLEEMQRLVAWRLMKVSILVIYVQMNKWVVGDVHHISILPTFSPLLLAYYFIHLNRCLHNVNYGQLTDEMFHDSKLLCQIYACFLHLFAV
jgi:hypothetical protein